MNMLVAGLVLWSLVAATSALYGGGDAVVDLTPANFDKQVGRILLFSPRTSGKMKSEGWQQV
jgi:hypothetical protein